MSRAKKKVFQLINKYHVILRVMSPDLKMNKIRWKRVIFFRSFTVNHR